MKVSARSFGKSRRQMVLSAAVASLMFAGHASAQLYWDTNGTTLGLGGAGTWDTSTANWSTAPLGDIATQAWTGGNVAVFSAGTTSTGSFTVTVPAGTTVLGINGITFEEGVVTLAAGDAASALGLNTNAIFQHGSVGSAANSRTHAMNVRLTGTGGASFLTAFPAASTGSFILNADNSGLSGIIAIGGAVTPPTAAQAGAVVLDVRHANALGASGFANRVQFGVSTLGGFTTNAALSRVLLRGGLTIAKDFELSGGASDNLSAQIRNIADTNTINGDILINGAVPNQAAQLPGIGADGGTLIINGVIRGVDLNTATASGGNTWTKTGPGTIILAGSAPNETVGLLRTFNGVLVARKDGAFGPAGNAADINQATIQNVIGGAQSTIAFDGGVNYATQESLRTAGSGTSTGFNGLGQIAGFAGNNIFAGNIHFTGGQPGGASTPVFGSVGVHGGTLELSGKLWATVVSPDPRTIVKLGNGTLVISGENNGVDGVIFGTAMEQTSLYGTLIAQGGALVFRGNGAMRGSDVGGTIGSDMPMNLQAVPGGVIIFDESAGSPVNGRLRANAQVQLVGGEFRLGGHAANPVTQTIGGAQVASYSKFSVSSPGGATTLDLGAATRSERGTALIAGAGTANARILASGELGTNIGGGGGAGSPLIGIVPALVGDASISGLGTDFVTNDASLGLRPLAGSEYAALVSGSSALNNVSTSGAQSVSANTTVNSLKMAGGTAVTINGGNTLNVNSGAILALGDSSVSGGALGFGGREGIFHVLEGGTLSVSSAVSGTDGVTKSGTGVLVLSGTNTYSGDTSINSGVLQFSSLANVGTGGAVVLNGGTLRPTASLTLPSGRPLRVGNLAGGTVEVATGATINLGDGITGNGLLIKTGGGTLNPQASNAGFNGNIRVDAGTLNAANTDQLGNGNLILNNGALNMTNGFEIIKQVSFQGTSNTVAVAAGQTSLLSGGMVGPAALTIEGGGTLVQNGALATNANFLGNYLIRGGSTLAYSSAANNVGLGSVVGTPPGYWTLDNGTLAWLNTIGTTGTFSVTPASVRTVALLAGGGTIFVDSTGSIVHNASVISGVGKLTKAGGGTLVLAIAHTYTGGTQIDSGWVRATTTGLGANANTLTFNGGTLIPNSANITGTRPTIVTALNGTIDATANATQSFNTTLGAVSGPGKLTVLNSATTTFTASSVRLGGLSVSNGTATLAAGPTPADPTTASSLGSVGTDGELTLTGSTLNISNNALVVHYNAGSPRAALEALIASGFAAGSWNGTGINSSSAAANAGNAVGIAEASDIGSPGTYAGLPIDGTTVLIRYSRSGDANVDGITDIGDFALLTANFNQAGTRWYRGDFNYDTVTDIADFALLASQFNQTATGDLPRGAAVPEPASLALFGLATALLGRRRR